jgi:quercetin dioxygenase-like cupin family protein
MNQVCRELGILNGDPPYERVVATQFAPCGAVKPRFPRLAQAVRIAAATDSGDYMLKRFMLCAAIAVAAAYGGNAANAQQDIKRTLFKKSDGPGTNYETVLGMAEIAPNTNVAFHTHPRTENSYVVQGSLTLEVRGQPASEVQAGESMFVPANTPHGGRSGRDGA